MVHFACFHGILVTLGIGNLTQNFSKQKNQMPEGFLLGEGVPWAGVGFKILQPTSNCVQSTRFWRTEASDQGKNSLRLRPTQRKFAKILAYLRWGLCGMHCRPRVLFDNFD